MVQFPDIAFDRTEEFFVKKFFKWIIDWKYRKAVNLKKWIKEQVDNPSKELIEYAESIPLGNNHDETALNILKQVIYDIKYVTDDKSWGVPEYWQTAKQTLLMKTGDCEDGAILIYVIARLKGVPSNRFLIFTGDVKGGGHCWVGYKPSYAPWTFVFLDWCYWVSRVNVRKRQHFFIGKEDNKNIIYPTTTNYYRVWFGFNEDVAFNDFMIVN